MNVSFKIVKKYSLGIEKCFGTATEKDTLNFMKQEYTHPEYKFVKYIVSDFRECKANFGVEAINKFVDIEIKYSKIDNCILNIFIVSKPMETAYLHIFANFFKNRDKKFEICSTLERAVSLLNAYIDITYEELNSILEKM